MIYVGQLTEIWIRLRTTQKGGNLTTKLSRYDANRLPTGQGLARDSSTNWKTSTVLQCAVYTPLEIRFQSETPVGYLGIHNATGSLFWCARGGGQMSFPALFKAVDDCLR